MSNDNRKPAPIDLLAAHEEQGPVWKAIFDLWAASRNATYAADVPKDKENEVAFFEKLNAVDDEAFHAFEALRTFGASVDSVVRDVIGAEAGQSTQEAVLANARQAAGEPTPLRAVDGGKGKQS